MLFNTPELLEKEPEKRLRNHRLKILIPGEGNTLKTLIRADKWTPG